MEKWLLTIPLLTLNLLGQTGTFTLSWNDNSDNEDGFVMERSIDGGTTWVEIGRTGVDVSTYTDDNVEVGFTYYYRVFAFNNYGNSGYSNEAFKEAALPFGPLNLRQNIPTPPPVEPPPPEFTGIDEIIEGESLALDDNWIIVDDPTANGGSYIVRPEGYGTGAIDGPFLTFNFVVEVAGTYRMWARVSAPDGGSDSFYIQFDDGPTHTWDTSPISGWSWIQLRDRSDPTVVNSGGPITSDFTVGQHTLKIRPREDGTRLDSFYIASDPSAPAPQ